MDRCCDTCKSYEVDLHSEPCNQCRGFIGRDEHKNWSPKEDNQTAKEDAGKFLEILQPIAEILESKNKDYGKSYDLLREKYGPVGFYIRVADKINRIEQLDTNPANVKDEAVEDTLNDIIGYCTLELNYRKAVR